MEKLNYTYRVIRLWDQLDAVAVDVGVIIPNHVHAIILLAGAAFLPPAAPSDTPQVRTSAFFP